MTIAITRLDGVSGGPTSLASNNITPGDNKLIFAFVVGETSPSPAGDPTISGGSLTWHVVANNTASIFGGVFGLRYKVAWADTGTGSGTFAVTANFGATSHNIWLVLDLVANADRARPIVQTTFATGTSTILNSTFTSPMVTGNGAWGSAWVASDSVTLTAGADYTLLSPAVTLATAGRAQTLWRPDADPSPDVNAIASSSVFCAMTGIEVRAAGDPNVIIGGSMPRYYAPSQPKVYDGVGSIKRYIDGTAIRRYG